MEHDKPRSTAPQGVTAREIREIVGEIDPGTTASIIATGATREDVLEAYFWLSADDSLHRELHRMPRGTVAKVYEILEAEIVPPDER